MIDIIIEALDMDMQGTTREITEHVCGRVSKDQILSVGPISGIRKQASVKGEDTVVSFTKSPYPFPWEKELRFLYLEKDGGSCRAFLFVHTV